MGLRLLAAVSAAAAFVSGCGTQPRILSVNYRVISTPDATGLISNLRSGSSSVESLLGPEACNLAPSFGVPDGEPEVNEPEINVSGSAGFRGFNASLSVDTPTNLTTTNDASCPDITWLRVRVGSSNETLALNQWTSVGSADFRLDGNAVFDQSTSPTDSRWFRGRIVRGGDGQYSSGDFEFATRQSNAEPTTSVLIGKGSWAR